MQQAYIKAVFIDFLISFFEVVDYTFVKMQTKEGLLELEFCRENSKDFITEEESIELRSRRSILARLSGKLRALGFKGLESLTSARALLSMLSKIKEEASPYAGLETQVIMGTALSHQSMFALEQEMPEMLECLTYEASANRNGDILDQILSGKLLAELAGDCTFDPDLIKSKLRKESVNLILTLINSGRNESRASSKSFASLYNEY